jgi:nicotinate dehydrogenase subunit A
MDYHPEGCDDMISIKVNGTSHDVQVEPNTPLLYVLHNELLLNGPKFGCGLAQCGACTVHVHGKAVRSCIMRVSAVGSAEVTTLEGLGRPDKLHPLQQAFIDEQAAQCGYCINGMIMQAAALLKKNATPDNAAIAEALAGNLCRCGTHLRIIRAVKRAGQAMTQSTR